MVDKQEIDWSKLTIPGSESMILTYTPLPIGYWIFPGSQKPPNTKIAAYSKPNWFHRIMMKLILGFHWEDVNKGESK